MITSGNSSEVEEVYNLVVFNYNLLMIKLIVFPNFISTEYLDSTLRLVIGQVIL